MKHPMLQRLKPGQSVGGFTLMELIITVVIAGLCLGLGWQAFVTSTETMILRDQLSTVADQGRLAMMRITRELRGASLDDFTTLTPATEITFTSNATKDGQIRYHLIGTDLYRQIVSTGEDNILAKGVADLNFLYDTDDPTTFNYIQVQFTVMSLVPGGELAKFPLRDRIYPRNPRHAQ